MDNFTLFSNRKRDLVRVIKVMSKWLEPRGLRLKENWQYFRTRKRCPDALGYRYGHTYTLIRKARVLSIKRQIRSYYKQERIVSAKFACSLLSRLGGLRHCNSQHLYADNVPTGLQRQLKDVVRDYQRKELLLWNMCLEQFASEEGISRTSKLSALYTQI